MGQYLLDLINQGLRTRRPPKRPKTPIMGLTGTLPNRRHISSPGFDVTCLSGTWWASVEYKDSTGTTTCTDQQWWTWTESTSTLTVEVTTAGCGESAGTFTQASYTSTPGSDQVTYTRAGATRCQLMQVTCCGLPTDSAGIRRDPRGGSRSGGTGGWRRLRKRLGAVTVGYKCHEAGTPGRQQPGIGWAPGRGECLAVSKLIVA